MEITKKQKYIIAWGGGLLLVSIAIAVPLIVQSTKKNNTSFNLSIINSHMQIATNNKATLAETQDAIVNMYQNGTTAKLSPQAQKAAQVLAQYIYTNKASKKFAFVLGKDHQDQQLLLLTIANYPVTPQANAFLRKDIQPAPINAQKQEDPFLVKQLSWVTEALHKVEFGILFWIYQHRLSSQEALLGTKQVPALIIAVNFQRVKTAHEQLQDQAWTKMIAVIQNLTSRQLKIRGDDQQLPSQTKIDASHIMLAIQKIITSDDKITKAASKLIKENNIEVQLNDKIGAIIITIKNYGNDQIITIFGFKATGTPLEVAQVKINAAQAGASLPTKLNEVFYGQKPTSSDVNVPIKDGVTFKLKSATTINNKGESTLTYEVDASPQVKGTKFKEVTFVVSGFETQAQARERIAAQAKINVVQNKIGVTFPTRLNQVFHGQTPLALDVNAPLKDGVTFKFKLATTINDQGESTLTYEVDVSPQVEGTSPQDVTFVVSGFETKDQKDARERIAAQAKINAAQNKIGVTSPTRLNQVFHGQTPLALDVNAPLKDGVTFKFQSATTINDQGESTLTYEVNASPQVEGTTPQDVTFVVSGFETKDQKDARERIARLAQVAIQKLVATNFTTGINKAQIAWIGKPLKAHVIEDIKKHINDIHAKALILPGDITITSDNIARTITIVIHNHGTIKTITITEFISIEDYLASGSNAIKDYLDQVLRAIPSSGGALIIPEGITSTQFDAYVKVVSVTPKMNKFAKIYKAKITSLTIPNSFTTIGAWFKDFNQITSLTIPNSVTTIGQYVFFSAKLTSLIIPNSVTAIGNSAFLSSPLTSLILGDQLLTIGGYAFQTALLTSLHIPNAVTTIGNFAFDHSPLTTLSLGNQLQTIGNGAFYKAQLTSLRIPTLVTTIGSWAFASSPLTNIAIFQDVTLGRDAFASAIVVNIIARPDEPSE